MKDYDSKNNRSTLDDEEELTVKQVTDGLNKLDQWNSVSTPNLQWFQQHVEVEKKRIRKKQWKDLLAFIFVAILVLSTVIAVVYRQPILFLYFQLLGIILLPLALYKPRKKVSNE
ncbi:YxlC family protein [Alkalicoccobacillus murimartini]|uniref:Flp pilus assembly protein TadB n=1 Tax=Alkalicoccobacillus murimartini TaxID=171685 RepID=A0ABT9YN59_9BACI|nr:YxlC family protein [Alkalicoccobacillus murimartini]MDQ0209305.1 Flp pilus assembly protein TadB [Alkalicoccobacillus murimartini]